MKAPRYITLALAILGCGVRADECADILKQGIYDEYHFTSDKDFQQGMKEFFSMSWDQYQQEKKKAAGGGSFSWGFKSIGLSGSNEKETFERYKGAYQQNSENFLSSKEFSDLRMKMVNESVVKAWQDCMNGKNVTAFYIGENQMYFAATVRYARKRASDPAKVRLKQVLPSPNLKPIGNADLASNSDLGEFSYVTQWYARTDKEAAALIVNVEGMDQVKIQLPRISEPPPKPVWVEKKLTAVVSATQPWPASIEIPATYLGYPARVRISAAGVWHTEADKRYYGPAGNEGPPPANGSYPVPGAHEGCLVMEGGPGGRVAWNRGDETKEIPGPATVKFMINDVRLDDNKDSITVTAEFIKPDNF